MQKYKGSWDYYQKLYANKMDKLEEMEKFLEKYNFTKLKQKEIENINDQSQKIKINKNFLQ